jgi:hypothetical protein
MLVDDIADRIAIACPAEIDAIVKDMWVGHTNGLLTENEMEALEEAARARREAIQTQSVRSRTRRRLHEPRPVVSHETRKRIGQWKADIKAACLAGYISKGGDKYLHELLAIPSVARGDYCLYSDAEMGQRINIKDRTIRQHRKDADTHGLVEVLGHGKDRKPCMVRPILRDGSPVFLDPKSAGKSATFSRLTRHVSAADLLLTDTLKTEYPPLPPVVPDAPEEGGRVFDQVEDEEPARPAETAQAAQQAPADLPGPRGTPTQPPGTENAPAHSAQAQLNVEPAVPAMSFLQFWVAMGQTGHEGYARAQWGRLTATDKAAIRDRLGRPRSWATDMWAGTWLKGRCWEEAVPAAARLEQVFIRENTPEWRCWQRHLGRSMPVNSQGGWWFSSKLPPLTDAEVPPKGQAHSSHEAPLDAESCPQHFTRRWPAPALCRAR